MAAVVDSPIPEYLELMVSQRQAIVDHLTPYSQEILWQRPSPKDWSIGENLDHSRRASQTFLRVQRTIWRFKENTPY